MKSKRILALVLIFAVAIIGFLPAKKIIFASSEFDFSITMAQESNDKLWISIGPISNNETFPDGTVSIRKEGGPWIDTEWKTVYNVPIVNGVITGATYRDTYNTTLDCSFDKDEIIEVKFVPDDTTNYQTTTRKTKIWHSFINQEPLLNSKDITAEFISESSMDTKLNITKMDFSTYSDEDKTSLLLTLSNLFRYFSINSPELALFIGLSPEELPIGDVEFKVNVDGMKKEAEIKVLQLRFDGLFAVLDAKPGNGYIDITTNFNLSMTAGGGVAPILVLYTGEFDANVPETGDNSMDICLLSIFSVLAMSGAFYVFLRKRTSA